MKISAYTTCLNSIFWYATLLQTVESALEFADEVVVVDGGSVDGTQELVREIEDDRVKLYVYPDRYKLGQASLADKKSFALSKTTGDWAVLMDSDEVIGEWDAPRIRDLPQVYPDAWGFKFKTLHFYRSWNRVQIPVGDWYDRKIYMVKKGLGIRHGKVGRDRDNFVFPLSNAPPVRLPPTTIYDSFLSFGGDVTVFHYGWCLLPNAPILTTEGVKSIEKITIGDYVLTHKGVFRRVTRVFKRRMNGRVIEILPCYSNLPVSLTPEHEVLAIKSLRCKYGRTTLCKPTCEHKANKSCKKPYKGYRLLWTPAYALKSGDFLAYPKFTSNNLKINDDLARLIGYYLAEGHVEKQSRSLANVLTFGIGEEKLVDDSRKIIEKVYDKKVSIKEKESKVSVIFYSKQIGNWFIQNFGKYSEYKHIPYWLLAASDENIKNVIYGLWHGDGYVADSKFELTTASKNLAFQNRLLLFRLGFFPSLTVHHRGAKWLPIYRLTVGGKGLKGFGEIMEVNHVFLNKRKHSYQKGFFLNGYAFFPIKQIFEKTYQGYVYNLEVEEDNTYCTLFTLHNCRPDHVLLMKKWRQEIEWWGPDYWKNQSDYEGFPFRFENPQNLAEYNGRHPKWMRELIKEDWRWIPEFNQDWNRFPWR